MEIVAIPMRRTSVHVCRLLYMSQKCDKEWNIFNSFVFDGVQNDIHRVSQEERTKLREGVPYVKLYRYNPKHLCHKLNGY